MAAAPSATALPVRARTQRLAERIIRHRRPIAWLVAAITLGFGAPLFHAAVAPFGLVLPVPRLEVDTNAADRFPDHPYIRAQETFSPIFGRHQTVALVLRVEDGDIYRPDVIAALAAITRELDGVGFDRRAEEREVLRARLEAAGGTDPDAVRARLDRAFPPYPVDHDRVGSLTHPGTRVSELLEDGSVQVRPVVASLPDTDAALAALRARVRLNARELLGRWVSHDERAALVTAGFVTERLDHQGVYRAIFAHVRAIEDRWEARIPDLEIDVTGEPIARGWVLEHVAPMLTLLLASVLVIAVLLWTYFRHAHGVVVPLASAATTAVWGLGFAAWAGIPLDPLILVVPMVITARAVSHAVQMTERFFEVYAEVSADGTPEARDRAATRALADLWVPGTLGVLTDVAGLAVIGLTTIPQMQSLALFGSFWVAAIVVTVEVLHPILLCSLPPPRLAPAAPPRFLTRALTALGRGVTHPGRRRGIVVATLVVVAASSWGVATRSQIGESAPGTPLLWPDHPFNRATAELARHFGGVDTLEVYVDGDRPQASSDPVALHTLLDLEETLARESALASARSMAPTLARSWELQHDSDPKWRFIPEDPGTLRSLVFQLRQNTPPGALRPLLSDDGTDGRAVFVYPDHRGPTIDAAVSSAEAFIAAHAPGELRLRLVRDQARADAGLLDRERLLDTLYYALGPMLPTRRHHLEVVLRGRDVTDTVRDAADGLPAWLEAFREAALAGAEARPDAGPEARRDWDAEDVDQWWEDERFGVRAVVVDTDRLIVADARAPDPAPGDRPTKAWTRGVALVMAGGSLGTLAAINEEVERSHLANLSLILAVIFVLHAITYRSVLSGGILALQLATVTLASLAFMALRGVGLNLHTLPVQAIGVGLGVDYAIYMIDRIRLETASGLELDAAIRRAISTTGLAVSFTATTIIASVGLWVFSGLRFQAEMAILLALLMGFHMLGALTIVPAFASWLRPRAARALAAADDG